MSNGERMRWPRAALLIVGAVVAASPSVAQQPTPATSSVQTLPDGRLSGIRNIAAMYGLTEAQAAVRMQLNEAVASIHYAVSHIPGYAGYDLPRTRAFRYIILITRDASPADFLQIVPTQVRPYTEFRKVRLNAVERIRELQALAAALSAADLNYALNFDSSGDLYRVTAESSDAAERLRKLVPETLRDTVRLQLGKVQEWEDARHLFHPHAC